MIQTTIPKVVAGHGRHSFKCAFCKKWEPLPFKRICSVCIKGCTTKGCRSSGDLFKCPKTNPRLTCGSMLKAGCLVCGKDKKSRFCEDCSKFLRGKASAINRIVADAR